MSFPLITDPYFNPMSPAVTIVSACDRNFLWGAFLLAASLLWQLLPH